MLVFVYYDMMHGTEASGLNNVFVLGAVGVAVLIAAVKIFLAKRRKK